MQAEAESTGPLVLRPPSGMPTLVPLFHAAWLFASGIALAHFLWLRPSLLSVAVVSVTALCCAAAVCAQRVVWVPLAVLWCLLGAWCAEIEPQPAPSQPLAALSDGLLRTVEGTVADAGPLRGEPGQSAENLVTDQLSQRIDLRLKSIEVVTDTEDTQVPIQGGLRLTVRWPA